MTDLIEPFMVPPGSTVRLSRDHDPGYTGRVPRREADGLLAEWPRRAKNHTAMSTATANRAI